MNVQRSQAERSGLHKLDYFEYERQVARVTWEPLLRGLGRFERAIDLGCGYGGVGHYLVESGIVGRATGVDLDEEMIRVGRSRIAAGLSLDLVNSDIMDLADDPVFDLVVLRDVVEHVPGLERLLAKAAALTKAGGSCLVSFSPFYSAFGGHQHCLLGLVSRIPFVQFLPASLIFKLSSPRGGAYKQADQLRTDLEAIYSARLTIRGFERALRKTPFRIQRKQTYLLRPEFRIKYSLPSVRNVSIPMWQELSSMGAYYILRKISSA